MAAVATTIQPVNSLLISNLGMKNVMTQTRKEDTELLVNIPNKETIQQDPTLYIRYMMECINQIRGDFHSLCTKNFPDVSKQLSELSDKTTNLKQEISERFDTLSDDNRDIRSKLDVLTKEIEDNKAKLEIAIAEITRNRQDMELQQERILKTMEERIIQSMNEVMQQNNDRFDMLSKQIQMISIQGLRAREDATTVQDITSQSQKVIPRGAYKNQEIDDSVMLSMSEEDLLKLRNTITSTKCRNKPAVTGGKDGVYEMCVANVEKINKRIQHLRVGNKI
jgi:hypothetical protein